MRDGWTCPVCGRGCSPQLETCPCVRGGARSPDVAPDPGFEDPLSTVPYYPPQTPYIAPPATHQYPAPPYVTYCGTGGGR
jgi:hypothetical protein